MKIGGPSGWDFPWSPEGLGQYMLSALCVYLSVCLSVSLSVWRPPLCKTKRKLDPELFLIDL